MGMGNGAIEAGRAFLKIVVDDADVAKGFDRMRSKMSTLGDAMQKWGAIAGGISGAVTAPFIAAIQAASDAQETMSKFDVVFGKQSKAVKAWGDELAKTVGRSKSEVAGMLASFQDLLVPMGMNAGNAETMSKQLAQLAIDLGSFNNMADADVARDLAAALTGSGEVMKKYGVIVSEAAVKQELLNMRLDPKTVTEAEKAQARLNIILRGTTAAQGDAERTAGGFANQMKALKSKLKDTAEEIGKTLLPQATDLIGRMNEAATAAADWIAANPDLVAAIGTIGGTATVAAVSVGALGVALTAMSAHPVIAGLAALVVAIKAVNEWLEKTYHTAEIVGKKMGEIGPPRPLTPDELKGGPYMLDRMGNPILDMPVAKFYADDPPFVNTNPSAPFAATPRLPMGVPHVATPGVDPMMKHLAALGLTGHEMNGAGGGRSLLFDGIGALGSFLGDRLPDLMDGVQAFFAPAEQQFSSMGTFSAAAVGSLQNGNVDKDILEVLKRIERKEDPWRV